MRTLTPRSTLRLVSGARSGLAISKPLDRDRAADETGHQVSVFGRIGSRPFNLEEMKKLYLTNEGKLWTVPSDQ